MKRAEFRDDRSTRDSAVGAPNFQMLACPNCPRRRSPVGGALRCGETVSRCLTRRAHRSGKSCPGSCALASPGFSAAGATVRTFSGSVVATELGFDRTADPRRDGALVQLCTPANLVEHRRFETDRNDAREPLFATNRRFHVRVGADAARLVWTAGSPALSLVLLASHDLVPFSYSHVLRRNAGEYGVSPVIGLFGPELKPQVGGDAAPDELEPQNGHRSRRRPALRRAPYDHSTAHRCRHAVRDRARKTCSASAFPSSPTARTRCARSCSAPIASATATATCSATATACRFDQLIPQVASLATALRDRHGIGAGDRVAVCAANCREWLMTFWAVAALDAVLVAMNGWWTGAEMRNALDLTDPKLLVMDEKRRERLDGDPGVPVLITEHDFAGLFDDTSADAPRRADRRGRPVHPHLHQRHHRSTQGRGALAPVGHLVPDGAVVHRRARHGDGGHRTASVPPPSDSPDAPPPTVRLAPYPLFHVSGMSMAVSTVMSGSPTVWPLGRFDPANVLRADPRRGHLGVGRWHHARRAAAAAPRHRDHRRRRRSAASASAAPPRRPT